MNPPAPSRPHLFGLLAGLALAASLAFTALVMARAWTRIAESQVINVTGSARKNVRSDLVIWRASFSAEAPTLIEAQQRLQADREKVAAFFTQRGIEGFRASPAEIEELTARRHDDETDTVQTLRVGYRLRQSVEVHSDNVDLLPQLAGESSELLQQGITFVSGGFDFIYTKAGEAKVEMMAEATRDARARAEQIAVQGGRQVAGLRNARMGVVQINPVHSSSTSWEGNNDTTSVDKTIIATITATFAMQ